MIVRMVCGGTGNQLFQYAFGRALSLKRGLPLQFYLERATRDYELIRYNLNLDFVPRPSGPIYEEPGFAFDPGVFDADPESYYRGYWQSPRYFKDYADIIRKEVGFKEPPPWGDSFKFRNTVFIHIRRGDYLNSGTREYHGVDLNSYYETAINYIKERVEDPCFLVFSDDLDWCRKNMPYQVLHCPTSRDELHLMSKCCHGIGANSSFSWWANYLGDRPGRISIAPKKWFVNESIDTRDLCPTHWIRL
jgi:hypothetical protein